MFKKLLKLMTYGAKTPHFAVAQPRPTIAHRHINNSFKKETHTSEFLLENRNILLMTRSTFTHINLKWF